MSDKLNILRSVIYYKLGSKDVLEICEKTLLCDWLFDLYKNIPELSTLIDKYLRESNKIINIIEDKKLKKKICLNYPKEAKAEFKK